MGVEPITWAKTPLGDKYHRPWKLMPLTIQHKGNIKEYGVSCEEEKHFSEIPGTTPSITDFDVEHKEPVDKL